jgi:hypothetical protein
LALQVTKAFSNLYTRLTIFMVAGLTIHWASLASDGFSNGPVVCPFRLVTGINCPACGTTRAIGALSQGQVTQSFNLNPLGILLTFTGLLFMMNPKFITTNYQRMSARLNKFHPSATKAILICAYIALWAWDFWRITPNSLS